MCTFIEFIQFALMIVCVDWSQEQLQKHSREIISLLGNLFMRATSAKIMKKVATVKQPDVTLVSESGAFAPLLARLKSLASEVDGQIQGFQLADAVESIVLALQEVCSLPFTVTVMWFHSHSF